MADFSNFELGQNVAELADGLIPEMAEAFEVSVSLSPSADQLGQLVGAIGTKKTLRDNEKGAKAWLTQLTGSETLAMDLAANWLERSGVQKALDRSLWTPNRLTPGDADIIITGGVANWQDRTGKLLAQVEPTNIWYAVGNRVMDTPTEIVNSNVKAYLDQWGMPPTEMDYAKAVIAPVLREAEHDVTIASYETGNGDEIAQRLFEDFDLALIQDIAVARVANAGIQLAVQMRKAARQINPDFDADPSSPNLFVLTDTFPIALSEDESKNAARYQNPFTGIRQVALTAKLLTEAA